MRRYNIWLNGAKVTTKGSFVGVSEQMIGSME